MRLRWDFGTDGCGGRVGWYVDNVTVFTCTANVPDVSIADLAIVEGNAASSQALFTVSLSKPTIKPVTVSYVTEDGTAQHGNDFDRVAGSVTVPAGAASVKIPVVIKGDGVSEGEESFTVRITGASFGTVVDDVGVGTIADDDAPVTASAP